MHQPVLSAQVVEGLEISPTGTYLDCTLGEGGHALEILPEIFPGGRYIGIDCDPRMLARARARISQYKKIVTLKHANFAALREVLDECGIDSVDGIIFDLGVSSSQLSDCDRGFSFSVSGPLDMRMDPKKKLRACDIINGWDRASLEKTIRRFGEEKFYRRIVSAILRRRRMKPIENTRELREIVVSAIPAAQRPRRIDPATRTFQAIRIAVNDEIENLKCALPQAIDSLKPGGRLAVISFHSLEDRVVKRTFVRRQRECICPPDFPVCRCGHKPEVKVITRKPVRPGASEIEDNPRSRSAKLRVLEKL